MADYEGRFVYLSTHEFKNDISRWLRELERGSLRAVLIKRHERVVAVCFNDGAQLLDDDIRAKRARRQQENREDIIKSRR